MTRTHPRIAVTTTVALLAALALAPIAPAEPKDQAPFTNAAGTTAVVRGESKGDVPFIDARDAVVLVRGEPKQSAPFTGYPQGATVIVRPAEGLDWTSFGIGAAASLGLVVALTGAALILPRGRRSLGWR